ncbi:cytosolic 5'-nucleotidase 3-like [Anneissia japonica]|uniref:cytosolic 5'-nucleotidase 3-like n=1 Tax=Anneissia japonica TaxID=1529436 RepID=UPI0014255F19|nr:cytosolic 5'-nucleotidase 3-like [Anneissia japonica]
MMQSSTFRIAVGAGVVLSGAALVTYYFNGSRKTKRTRLIEMIPEFQKANIHIRDPDKVEEIVTALIKGGRNKLQVISDFDRTITRHHVNGKVLPTTHGILESSTVISEESKKKAQELRAHYHPLEMSSGVSDEEKYTLMTEWWSQAHTILLQSGMTRKDVTEMVAQSDVMLREGCDQLFKLLADNSVPLLVFSAGIADILYEVIKDRATLHDNISVMSNEMDFDTDGQLVGFKGKLIHTYNKREMAKINQDYFERNKNRTNVLLMGDTIGDLQMAEGLKSAHNILKIGFLNSHFENLEVYKSKYDVVVVDDSSMDVANALLNKVM